MSDILGRHTMVCDNCEGKGEIDWFGKNKCSRCNGKGFVIEDLDEPMQEKKITTTFKFSLAWDQLGLLLALILFLMLRGC